MTTAGRPFIRLTARWRSSSDSTRGCRISTNSWSGNWASRADTRRAAVSPVASETTWSSTGVCAGATAESLEACDRVHAGVGQGDEGVRGELDLEPATAGADHDQLVVAGRRVEVRRQLLALPEGADAALHVPGGALRMQPVGHPGALAERLQVDLGCNRDA